ncbi:MAG TPA: hypothetical protein VFN42_06880 [Acetobacteraceae bacterium]|nr:hypothetical protein [Acetobacteraceae bacterium]
MPMLPAEPIPALSEDCVPPAIIGVAALTTAAVHGATPAMLAAMIERPDADPIARLYDAGIAHQLAFRCAEGLELQDQALAASLLFRVRRDDGDAGCRLLALVLPGRLMANTPLDFITNHLDVRLDLLFVQPGGALPAGIPDHDIAFFAAGDADDAMIARLGALFDAWPRPALNDPRLLPRLARDRLPTLLAGVPGICAPPAVAASRARLDALLRDGGDIAALLPGCGYPVLVRPLGSHAGHGLRKLESAKDLAAYMTFSFAPDYYVTAFADYRSPDGLYRKYRVAFIDREPFLCHVAASQHWMVHYLNAGMTESADKRADEARAMAQFAVSFAHRHGAAFAALHERLPFDYYAIDCGETPDGRLLVFEADTAAIIHLMDPPEMFPYKHVQMRRVFDAFGAMLERRGRRVRASLRDAAAGD